MHITTILIGDESLTIREKITTLLSEVRQDIRTKEAVNAQDVLAKTRHYQPELVILNLQLPGGVGLETLQQLKALEPSPLVILLTAYSPPGYQTTCLEAGADYFFDKAFEIERMEATLRQLIQRPK